MSPSRTTGRPEWSGYQQHLLSSFSASQKSLSDEKCHYRLLTTARRFLPLLKCWRHLCTIVAPSVWMWMEWVVVKSSSWDFVMCATIVLLSHCCWHFPSWTSFAKSSVLWNKHFPHSVCLRFSQCTLFCKLVITRTRITYNTDILNNWKLNMESTGLPDASWWHLISVLFERSETKMKRSGQNY